LYVAGTDTAVLLKRHSILYWLYGAEWGHGQTDATLGFGL